MQRYHKAKVPSVLAALVLTVFIGSHFHSSNWPEKNIQSGYGEPGVELTELTQLDQFMSVKPLACVTFDPPFPNQGILAQICIKNLTEDAYISAQIVEIGAWEEHNVNNVVEALSQFKNATFLDIGSHIGMYTVVVAAMKRQVVAVDAEPINLAYLRTSLDLTNTTQYVRMVNNPVSNERTSLYTYLEVPNNSAATRMMTIEELKKKNLAASGPAICSVTVMDILNTIPADTVVIKIDVEGYECKALQPDILLGRSGKYIPYIFMEWFHLTGPHNNNNCPEYEQWVELFYQGGYRPVIAGTMEPLTFSINDAANIAWIHNTVK